MKATLHHILVGCHTALADHRYTWRHDSVLKTLLQTIQPTILKHNATPPRFTPIPPINKSFVVAGKKGTTSKSKRVHTSLLGVATDWKLFVDFHHSTYLFPPHIVSSAQRPDILLYSNSTRTVIFGELTCPAEEGTVEAHLRKQARYSPLADQISKLNWTVHNLTLEVCARGFVARSTFNFFRQLGLSHRDASFACKEASEVAARCSLGIFDRRDKKVWNSSRDLLVPQSCIDAISEIDPSLQDK